MQAKAEEARVLSDEPRDLGRTEPQLLEQLQSRLQQGSSERVWVVTLQTLRWTLVTGLTWLHAADSQRRIGVFSLNWDSGS